MSGPPVAVGAALLRRRLVGIAFLTVIAALVWLTVLLYQKAFTPIVKVSVQVDRIGNQLSTPADVKVRGVLVGTVRDITATPEGATLELGLKPDKVALIPQNVHAQLLPKTLFGEKYVELVIPADPAAEHLKDGDVIAQDRSSTAMETARALDGLLPLLQSLKPVELSKALNGLSSALRDRGDRLGANFVAVGAYLEKLNPALPTLQQDFAGLADFANNTAAATPALLTVLDNFAATSRTLVEEKPQLDAFLSSTSTLAASATSIVAQNEKRLISLARDSRPVLELFARYSPEYPCFLAGLRAYDPIVTRTFGGGQPGLHITVEATEDNGAFVPGQEPQYRDTRGPACWGLPNPARPAPDTSFDDGYRTSTTPSGGIGVPALDAVVAPVLGVPNDQVPDLARLLLGPVAQGHEVGLS